MKEKIRQIISNYLINKQISKEFKNYKFHNITAKIINNSHFFEGQFLKIDIEPKKNHYYFSSIDGMNISAKLNSKDTYYYENYNYAIVREICQDNIITSIICCDGYLQRYKINLSTKFKNGDAFIINNGNLIFNNKIVGKIIDYRYDKNNKILLNSLDNNELVVFIKK